MMVQHMCHCQSSFSPTLDVSETPRKDGLPRSNAIKTIVDLGANVGAWVQGCGELLMMGFETVWESKHQSVSGILIVAKGQIRKRREGHPDSFLLAIDLENTSLMFVLVCSIFGVFRVLRLCFKPRSGGWPS